jgi:RNA-directed DNA polymerase
MFVQRWIAQHILQIGRPHHASMAYAKGNTIYDAAQPHCGCRWLVKLDIRNFFESVSEIAAYRVFRAFGYQALPSFELARLTTRAGAATALRSRGRWLTNSNRHFKIAPYRQPRLGHLPQGAPTSPMLANLAAYKLDEALWAIAGHHGLVYTRYADDLAFSTRAETFDRKLASKVIGETYTAMALFGFSPNATKARISPPGGRKVVLGLVVDGSKPRLTREFKSRLRQHLYYLRRNDFGPAVHAQRREFASIVGLRHHVHGLIAYARQIEPKYGEDRAREFTEIVWPV